MRLLKLLFMFMLCPLVYAQQAKIDSLNQALKGGISLPDSARLGTKLQLAEAYISVHPDTALQLAEAIFEEAKAIPSLQIASKRIISLYYRGKDAKMAIKHLQEGLDIALLAKNLKGEAQMRQALGSVLMEKSEYQASMEMLFKALKLYEEQNNSLGVASVYNDLGIIYSEQSLFEKSREMHLKNLETGKEIGNRYLVMAAYINLAYVELKLQRYDDAISNNKEALAVAKELNQNYARSLVLCNTAECFLQKKDLKESLRYAEEALQIATDGGYLRVVAQARAVLGAVFLQNGKADMAIQSLESSLQISNSQGLGEEKYLALEHLYLAYEKKGQTAKSYQAYKDYIIMRDSLSRFSDMKELIQKDGEHKEEKIRLEQEKKELANKAEIERQARLKNTYLGIAGTFVLIIVLGLFSYRQKQRDNKRLVQQHGEILAQKHEIEQNAKEIRTAHLAIAEKNDELNEANEELLQQQEELIILNENLEAQKQEVEKIYTRLKDTSEELGKSIQYASNIQKVVMPETSEMRRFFQDLFVLYKPKALVSGDFYWFSQISEERAVIALADCTGHGVPGAFMSMLGSTLLHEIVSVKGITDDPARVLRNLHSAIRKLLRQNEVKNDDGMDISICVFEKGEDIKLTFAGAKSKMFYVKQGEIFQINGDNQCVGGKLNKREFVNQTLFLPKEAVFYMLSDGYADQNDAQRQKIGSHQLKSQLLLLHTQSFDKQKEHLEQLLKAHQGEELQRDDISIIGLMV